MNNSGLNTVLLIIILVTLVGGAVWYVTNQTNEESGASLELTVPSGDDQ